MRAVNYYILGRADNAKALLDALRLRALAGSAAVQRGRLVVLVVGPPNPRSPAPHLGGGATLRLAVAPRSTRSGLGSAKLMCGIVGAVSASPVDRELLASMRDRLTHRGPDAAGLWSTELDRVCLGHRRLSIIDPSPEADQPFASLDGLSAITLNGEIYNFRSLRSELELEGARFRTRSDTEVLLAAYERWGASCLERLSGMFAFAVWDGESKKLFCARDRAGEKPLYYTIAGDTFLFASELKALLLWPGLRRELDFQALGDFLTFGFIPDPKTVWEGMRKLPPAHVLEVELGESGPRVSEPTAYWDLEFEPDDSVEDWGPAIRTALEQAAGEMAYADVPVGTFLSGASTRHR